MYKFIKQGGKLRDRIEANKTNLWCCFTKLIKKVKKLEQIVKTSQAKRRTKIIASDDEEDLVVEDPSKQERSMIEGMDLDAGISLVPLYTEVQGRYRQNLDTQEGFGAGLEVTTADTELNTASTFVSIVSPQRHADTTADDLTLAETLMEIRKLSGFIDVEWDDVFARFAANEDFVQQLQAGEKCSEEDLPMKLVELFNQRKKFFAQQGVKEIFETTMRKVQSFVPMGYELKVQRLKRVGQEVLEEPVKRQKIGEALGSDDKEKELWVELKRLFEPDNDDTLWKLQRYMHDPLVWRLYDTCGVHRVSSVKGHEIFMLVEKEYPLIRGLITVMLANKLQVDQYSEMVNELLRKNFILANTPRH
ncbi:hypothetical protein Tco_0628548 [Tanacetum coccineum]|uniref:Uncharacterized protein n=1 Tax=Tanacetum coccineum TaxID=301880 RepID=A0ABQ4WRC5_9ASTR